MKDTQSKSRCDPSNVWKNYNHVASKSCSPSIMHDGAVVIWTVEIVCQLFPEVVQLVCQNIKEEGNTSHLMGKKEKGNLNAVTRSGGDR